MKESTAGICPICEIYHTTLVHHFNPVHEGDVLSNIIKNFPSWKTSQGICSRCYDEFEAITYYSYQMNETPIDRFKLKHLDFYILPLHQRLNADTERTGKGVTICVIDSGFYLHPDFSSRVMEVIDITKVDTPENYFQEPHDNAWHGTMTVGVCAGNGFLSGGRYKGLAHNANLVLLKVQDEDGHITDENICKALSWVKNHHKQHDIRIVNMSLGGNQARVLNKSRINQLAEELFAENVLVVAAVGNSTEAEVLPPASSPHVVSVGGLDDQNKLDGDIILYHSTYGITLDGVAKPELISNSIWIPAPILPNSSTQKKAAILFQALENEDYMAAILENNKSFLQHEKIDLGEGKEKLWKEIKKICWKEKFITPSYMHVDGTSFAAPIVASVAAQMLEANPLLSAAAIRQTLLKTASPLPMYDIRRQGYGRLHPKMAVYAVSSKTEDPFMTTDTPIVNYSKKFIRFQLHLPHEVRSVSICGSFNNWKRNEVLLKPVSNNGWFVQFPLLPAGRYEYKFFINNEFWQEDFSNPWRVVDRFGGWNSIFTIEQ